MLSLSSSNRFTLYLPPTDMRKSFDGLMGLVQNELERDPATGEVFVFINRRRDKIKLLHWEQGGFVLYYKRLEKGTLELPRIDGKSGRVNWSDLVLMIEGISLEKIHRRKRFSFTS